MRVARLAALLVLLFALGAADAPEGEDAEPDAQLGAAELEAAGVPAWRELWRASLEALRREPSINETQEDVLVQLGAPAYLHCPVRNLGERGVSWVRRRDWHIISSGVFMYTNDERFQVLHSEGSDDWILQIKYVQKRDNGTYECQVSSGTGTLSRLVHLHVAVPEAFILGAEEYHVDAGSTINLVCIIEKSPAPPQYVFWYHNGRMVNYDAARGVSVATAPGARTHSALRVAVAAPAHSGNYSCRAANAPPASVTVYVSEGSTCPRQALRTAPPHRPRTAPHAACSPRLCCRRQDGGHAAARRERPTRGSRRAAGVRAAGRRSAGGRVAMSPRAAAPRRTLQLLNRPLSYSPSEWRRVALLSNDAPFPRTLKADEKYAYTTKTPSPRYPPRMCRLAASRSTPQPPSLVR
ncbi:hemicentin-2-like [Battus philenor]|uniref:hemicentin-2-like n=1 Tax=Battus philenor TaxID=42288 RepID=UPI0035CEB0D2